MTRVSKKGTAITAKMAYSKKAEIGHGKRLFLKIGRLGSTIWAGKLGASEARFRLFLGSLEDHFGCLFGTQGDTFFDSKRLPLRIDLTRLRLADEAQISSFWDRPKHPN